jgi:hypothetical protein
VAAVQSAASQAERAQAERAGGSGAGSPAARASRRRLWLVVGAAVVFSAAVAIAVQKRRKQRA